MHCNRKQVIISLLGLLFCLSACVKENTEPCGGQELHIYFYSRTPCQTTATYPDEVHHIRLALFDNDDVLTAYDVFTLQQLNYDYYRTIQIPSGSYSIIAWTGVEGTSLQVSEPVTGSTTRDELLFRLNRLDGIAYNLYEQRIYYGKSGQIEITENRDIPPVIYSTEINLLEITNRITVTVEDIPADLFEVLIQSGNGSMNINGTNAIDELIYYRNDSGDNPVSHFTMLKLDSELTNRLVIRNTATEAEVFNEDLLELLMKIPDMNLQCDHDFTIRIAMDETYTITNIWVNDWLVHSYEKEM